MQTFIPYADIEMCAKVLDYRRLGKQRVEAFQISQAISLIEDDNVFVWRNGKQVTRAWVNHPCVRMWQHNKDYLHVYARAICKEWIRRGYQDTMLDRFTLHNAKDIQPPSWWGREEIHRSHRSQLLAKNFAHYSSYFKEDIGLPYIWAI